MRRGFIDVDRRSIPAPDSLAGRLCSIRGLSLALVIAAFAAPLIAGIRVARKGGWGPFAPGLLVSLVALVVLTSLQLLTSSGTESSPFAISLALLALGAGTTGLVGLPESRRRIIARATAGAA